jgi:hypothetical protein
MKVNIIIESNGLLYQIVVRSRKKQKTYFPINSLGSMYLVLLRQRIYIYIESTMF